MTIYRRTGGAWNTIAKVYRRAGGTWNTIAAVYRRANSVWHRVYSATLVPSIQTRVELTQSTNSNSTIKLTGKLYHWNNATSVKYYFARGTNGTTYTNISGATGTSTNPASGSSNINDQYTLTTSDVTANVTNYYIYKSVGYNSTYGTEQTSASDYEVVEGVRNVTVTNTSHDSGSLTFTITDGTYANGYIYQVSTDGSTWDTQKYSSSSVIYVNSYNGTPFSSSTTYYIRVKGVTGTSLANPGYSGYFTTQSAMTDAPVEPNVITYPYLSGTAQAFNTLTSSTGNYSNYDTGTSVQTFIMALPYDDADPTQGILPVDAVQKNTPSTTFTQYQITQYDATWKPYKFYAVDKVKAIGSNTYYYYFSPVKISYIGTVTDNFNRSTSGMGTMSSGYTYSGPYTSPSWSVNGSYAVSSATPSFNANYNTWGLRSVEMSGRTDINASVKFPAAEGGLGLAFWVTGSGSWWASTVEKYKTTTTSSGCNGTQISTNASGTGCGGCAVSSSQATSYHCAGSSNTYPNCSNGSYNCSATYVTPSLACTGSGQGASCPSFSYSAGGYCGNCSGPYTPSPVCDGPYYSYSDNTLSTGCGGKCSCTGPYTTTTYGCGSGTTNSGCPAAYTTTYDASTVGTRCSSCIYLGGGLYFYSTVSASTSSSYTCRVSTCAPTYYTYSTYQQPASYYSCTPGSSITTSYTCNPYITTSTTTYYTAINISAASGSTVYTQTSLDVHSSTSNYASVYGMTVNTSGNTITAKLYSDYNFSTQLGGTLTYTPSNPTKSDIYGSSSAGIANGPSDDIIGTYFEDFTVS